MLNKNDYFKVNNGYLSRTKIQDFHKCPNYFFRKHILGEIEDKRKDCFVTGTAVDSLLAQIDMKERYFIFDGDFRSTANKELKAAKEAEGFIVVKPAEYESIMALAIAVENTDAYRNLVAQDYEKQKLLQMEMDFKAWKHLFVGVAAMPDFIKITGAHADICDLKTASQFKLDKWYYHCNDYGYFKQFALQTLILASQGINSFSYKHLVVDKTENINSVYAIEIPDNLFSVEEIMADINEIIYAPNFDKANPTWDKAYILKNPYENNL